MIAILVQKVGQRKTAYGEKTGGESESGITFIQSDRLENVTKVEVVLEGTAEFYEVTHQTGDDAAPHATRYSTTYYSISVIGG